MILIVVKIVLTIVAFILATINLVEIKEDIEKCENKIFVREIFILIIVISLTLIMLYEGTFYE